MGPRSMHKFFKKSQVRNLNFLNLTERWSTFMVAIRVMMLRKPIFPGFSPEVVYYIGTRTVPKWFEARIGYFKNTNVHDALLANFADPWS